ncbi:MAG: AtpZ/AtpI family protein [Bacteroidota bacterium]|nr:AtpZ/AtpI family protein [Bacteroidota bacterium]MEC7618620.1 AtpZ/AtpI family protein [Bacteroidota bacterium]MEC8030949.1 AtpZ/AtpI family protein [Bacteroidota bacterium]|tara:strand:+ start:385 stop:585 length:201 start_codon:yes stop_codon:yes gene_type:complete
MRDLKNKKHFIKYSNMVVQMGVIIGVFAYVGHYLDLKFDTSKKYWTMILSLAGVFGAIYQMIRSLR